MSNATDNYQNELTQYIDDFLEIYPQRAIKAKKYIPTIIEECGDDIDPLLVAVMISYESAWMHGAIGFARKEKGLLQVHGRASQGYDLDDPHEQIRAGVTWLRKSIKWCDNDIERGLNAYGTGRCKPIKKFVKWRVLAWQRAIKKYRSNNERKK